MSYLQDSQKRKKKAYLIVFALLALLAVFWLRKPLYNAGSSASRGVGSGISAAGRSVGGFFGGARAWFHTRSALYALNANLLSDNEGLRRELMEKDLLSAENAKLKEVLGRKAPESKMVLGVVLAKPNKSPYDTLVLDVGEVEGVKAGQKVFADGIIIGEIAESSTASSKVKLYSTPGEKLDVAVAGSDVYLQAVGRGGGNFEITLPSGIEAPKGTEIYIPHLSPLLVGIAEAPISSPNDPFQKVIVRSTINFNHVKWVEIKVN